MDYFCINLIFDFFSYSVSREESQKDTHRASLMWCPVKEEAGKVDESK